MACPHPAAGAGEWLAPWMACHAWEVSPAACICRLLAFSAMLRCFKELCWCCICPGRCQLPWKVGFLDTIKGTNSQEACSCPASFSFQGPVSGPDRRECCGKKPRPQYAVHHRDSWDCGEPGACEVTCLVSAFSSAQLRDPGILVQWCDDQRHHPLPCGRSVDMDCARGLARGPARGMSKGLGGERADCVTFLSWQCPPNKDPHGE